MKFLFKNLSPIFLIISFFSFFFVFFKSNFTFLNLNSYYKFYYLISVNLIFFSLISFLFSKKTKIIISQIIIIFIISLYLFEFVLTVKNVYFNASFKKIYKQNSEKKFDTRTQLQVYKDMKKDDNSVSIPIPPRRYLGKTTSLIPLSSISNSTMIGCNEIGYYPLHESDRYGFNNNDIIWDKDLIKFLIIGDSVAFGDCVESSKNIPSNLSRLSNQDVLNLGNRGNGPLLDYATLREYLKPNVGKIIWLYSEGNNFIDLKNEIRSDILLNYIKDQEFTQNLKFKQKIINQMAKQLIYKRAENKKKFSMKNFIKLNASRAIFHSLYFRPTQTFELVNEMKNIFNLMNDLAIKNNSKLYFVYLPSYFRYSEKFSNQELQIVKKIINELNVPFIDIDKEFFQKQMNPLSFFPFEKYGHYTELGYKEISKTIYKLVKD